MPPEEAKEKCIGHIKNAKALPQEKYDDAEIDVARKIGDQADAFVDIWYYRCVMYLLAFTAAHSYILP